MSDEIRQTSRSGSPELSLPSMRLTFRFGRWELSDGRNRREISPGEAVVIATLLGGDEWRDHVRWAQHEHLEEMTRRYKAAADAKAEKIRTAKDDVAKAAVAMAAAEMHARAVRG